jgi:cytochrome oxidase Cu insertion factor (SCO1/SenC/PrrC family)
MTRRASLILAIVCLAACRHQSKLPSLYPVPDASLVDEHAKPLRLGALNGSVVVYDFIFTNCAGTCPMMTATMRKLTRKVPADAPVRFVSISVDPARDTPAVLHNYASKMRNDDRWLFLTGDPKTIVDLSVNGFKLAAGSGGPANESILHSSKFIVADKRGVIRDYYAATSDDAVDHVAAVIRDLAAEER